MITWAIRHHPVVLELQQRCPPWVLDVGSGPEGIQLFWRGRVVGIDLCFKRRSLHRGVVASGLALPLADDSCPFVVSCDMLEHMLPEVRRQVVMQMARVAGERLVLVFPSGQAAEEVYQAVARVYQGAKMPEWLRQHLEYGLPEAVQVEGWLREAGWRATTTWYEPARLHKALLRWELRYGGKLFSYSLMRLLGPLLAPRLSIPEGEPKLRVMIKAQVIR